MAHKDPLASRAHDLKQALAHAGGYERDWTTRIENALTGLIDAFHEHVRQADSPKGVFDVLSKTTQQTELTLTRRVIKLREEHINILDQAKYLLTAVRRALEGPANRPDTPAPDYDFLRRCAVELVEGLDRHQEVENKIFMDAMNTDVGVGD